MKKQATRIVIIFFLASMMCMTSAFAENVSISFYDIDGNLNKTISVISGTKVSNITAYFPALQDEQGEDVIWTRNKIPGDLDLTEELYENTSFYAISNTNAESDKEMSNFSSKIDETYKLFRNIALPLAALALAYCGLALLLGSEKDAEVAKKRIFFILLAIVVLYLLPLIVKEAMNVGAKYAWSPSSPAQNTTTN